MARAKSAPPGEPDKPDGDPGAQDGQPNEDELRRRREAKAAGTSVNDRQDDDDGEDGEQITMSLNIPGARPAKSGLKGVRQVSVEGKLIGVSVKQLGGEITDPDQIVELRVLARLDHNQEVPVRDGSGETATTQSVIKRQHLRVLRIEVLANALSDGATAQG